MKEKARVLGIELVFVPLRCTDLVLPLDIKVFGALKSYARMIWRDYYHLNPEKKITHATVAKQITRAWQMVGEKTVTSAWSIMDDEDFLDTVDLGDF